jgi:hypothetical protein
MNIGAILLAVGAATTGVDNLGFYETRVQQILKEEDARELQHGYVRGDSVPYFTWNGFVSGKAMYFEVHGEKIRLITGQKKTDIRLAEAPSLPGADGDSRALDDKGLSLFVKSAMDAKHSLLCIESLGPDTYIRPRPYMEVYLITNPLGRPRLYRLSGINASCRGIERGPNGELLVPVWHIERKKIPNVTINYFSIGISKFIEAGVRVTGQIVDEYAQTYELVGDR